MRSSVFPVCVGGLQESCILLSVSVLVNSYQLSAPAPNNNNTLVSEWATKYFDNIDGPSKYYPSIL